MHHPQFIHTLSYHHTTTPLPMISSYFFNNKSNYNNSLIHGRLIGNNARKCCVSEESRRFEVDPDKAREALSELDQQIEVLSNKKLNPPKVRDSSIYTNLKDQMREDSLEISGPFLTFIAFSLFIFTIFYNVIFLTVIKPSIDLPIT